MMREVSVAEEKRRTMELMGEPKGGKVGEEGRLRQFRRIILPDGRQHQGEPLFQESGI
jgi:hypothetical protein